MNIPAHYFTLAQAFQHGGELIQNSDAFGNELETELASICTTAEQIQQETAEYLSYYFLDDEDEDDANATDIQPDALLLFAADGAGNHFGMDISQSDTAPRVLYWDDGILQWRTIAHSLDDFFKLFTPD